MTYSLLNGVSIEEEYHLLIYRSNGAYSLKNSALYSRKHRAIPNHNQGHKNLCKPVKGQGIRGCDEALVVLITAKILLILAVG